MVGCGWNAGVGMVGRAAILEILIGSAVPMTSTDVAERPVSGDACPVRDGQERRG
jgi:hypothetical protein